MFPILTKYLELIIYSIRDKKNIPSLPKDSSDSFKTFIKISATIMFFFNFYLKSYKINENTLSYTKCYNID